MWRRGHLVEGSPRPHGPYRTRLTGRAYLVPQVVAEPHRLAARHDVEGSRADSLFRELRRHRAGTDPAEAAPAAERGRVSAGARRLRRRPVYRVDRRRSAAHGPLGHRSRRGAGKAACRVARDQLGGAPQEARQAAEAGRGVHRLEQPAGMDDPGSRSGHPAGAAPAGAARRRPLRDLGSERPLSPGHQPQQPAEAAHRAARARHHRAQREAHASGGRRRVVRQWPARAHHHRRQQAAAEVAFRHAEGQAGPLPPEPLGQARRLFGPFGHRRRPGAQITPVRPAQEDGARAVQAVHLFEARALRSRQHDQGRQAHGREGAAGGVGHPRRGDPRAPGAAEPRSDFAPARDSSLRAGADRGQGDPAAPARLHRLQRRFRRRSDGGSRAAVIGGAARGAGLDDVDQQHPVARQRQADHRAVTGHRARPLSHHDGA